VPDDERLRSLVPQMVEELDSDARVTGEAWDLCYLYVYPDHWPETSDVVSLDSAGGAGKRLTAPGNHTWCLVGYLVSASGARRLLSLLSSADEEVYAPVDNMVSDWRARGLLKTHFPSETTRGLIENRGQLDMREGRGGLQSNIWKVPLWAQTIHSGGAENSAAGSLPLSHRKGGTAQLGASSSSSTSPSSSHQPF